MKRILFIGNNSSKINHIEPAKKRGYEIFLLKKNPSKKEKLIFDKCLDFDPFEISKILSFLEKVGIDGAITRFEPYIPVLGAICDSLNLPGPSLEACLDARDKIRMRNCFQKKSVPCPKYQKITSRTKLDFPFLLKPNTGAKSRYIQLVKNKKDLSKKYKFCLGKIQNSKTNLFREALGIKSEIFAEELLQGKQYTTTSFVFNGKVVHLGIADIVSTQDLGGEGFHLISRTTPTRLPKEYQEKILSVSAQGIKALGLDNIPVHPELIYTKEGPKILEMAARIGGYRSEMEKYSSGIDLDELALDICLGQKPNTERKFKKACTAVEIWPEKSGKIKKINLDEIKQIKEVKKFVLNRKPGQNFQKSPIGTKPLGWFLVQARTPEKSEEIGFEVLEKLKNIV